jgi:hypothetical protein
MCGGEDNALLESEHRYIRCRALWHYAAWREHAAEPGRTGYGADNPEHCTPPRSRFHRRQHPGKMPSSTAARVACIASLTRSFFSFTSTAVAPPTRMTAATLESFAKRSRSFSPSLLDLYMSSIAASAVRMYPPLTSSSVERSNSLQTHRNCRPFVRL